MTELTELSFPKELEPFDHLMLKNEHDPRGRSGFLAVSILEAAPDPASIRAVYDRASRVVVRLRQKVVVPTLPIAAPEWVVDPAFDLDLHVRHVSLPAPGGLRDLLDLGEQILAAPFDLDRPLWELHVVDRAAGGRRGRVADEDPPRRDGRHGGRRAVQAGVRLHTRRRPR